MSQPIAKYTPPYSLKIPPNYKIQSKTTLPLYAITSSSTRDKMKKLSPIIKQKTHFTLLPSGPISSSSPTNKNKMPSQSLSNTQSKRAKCSYSSLKSTTNLPIKSQRIFRVIKEAPPAPPPSGQIAVDMRRWIKGGHCVVLQNGLSINNIFHNCLKEQSIEDTLKKSRIIYLNFNQIPYLLNDGYLPSNLNNRYKTCTCALELCVKNNIKVPFSEYHMYSKLK